jgi:hypothetical protein
MNVVLNRNEFWLITICGVINYITQNTKSCSRICTCFDLKTFNSIIMISNPISSIIIIRNIMRYIICYKCPIFDWTSNCIFLYIHVSITMIILPIIMMLISIIFPWNIRNIIKWHVLLTLTETRLNICWFLHGNKKPGWICIIQFISPAIIPTAISQSDWHFSYFWSIICAYTLHCCVVCKVIGKCLRDNIISICNLKVNCIPKAICSRPPWYKINRPVKTNYSRATFI